MHTSHSGYICVIVSALYRDLAVDLLKMVDDSNIPLAQLCSRCAASMTEINSLHEKVKNVNKIEESFNVHCSIWMP